MTTRIPALRLHKATGQAYVVINKKALYLGRHDDPRTRNKYDRMIAQWLAAGRQLPVPPCELTVAELLARFFAWAISHYCPGGAEPDYEIQKYRRATRHLRQLYGDTRACEFGPLALQAVRQQMIDAGWCRRSVNLMLSRVKAVFRWGVAQQLLPSNIFHGLQAVTGLRYGRTTARESDPVRGVPLEQVQAVRPFLSRQVRALVDLQLLTGARGGELLKLRPGDIDRSRAIWTYRPQKHKTALHGKIRTIYFGPKAQAVLTPFLLRPDDRCLFSPAEAEHERRQMLHQVRKTPLSCGNRPGSNLRKRPQRRPGDYYTPKTYARAIERACDRAFALPQHLAPGLNEQGKPETRKQYLARLTAEQKQQIKAFRKAHRWHPHQLRHSAATMIRREFGLEAAQLALGHSSAQLTDAVYAERDLAKVEQVMMRIG
ncbi:tyrosine-type recombinase/integrase [Fontivita pretiosa]|uniref:tyrosine-type recombinase/integrase n=1 Tax=Fontivita pretiosa TaxID=2989684 RepID=UPI003D1864AF